VYTIKLYKMFKEEYRKVAEECQHLVNAENSKIVYLI